MELFKKRPLALICGIAVILMLFALDMSRTVRIGILVLLAFGVLVSVTVALLYRKGKPIRTKRFIALSLFLIISAILVAHAHVFASKSESANNFEGKETYLSGKITEVRFKSSSLSSVEANVFSINEKAVDLNLILEIQGHSTLKRGDSFYAVGNITQLSFNDEYYLMAEGIHGKVIFQSASDIKTTGIRTDSGNHLFKRINGYLEDVIYENTDEETGALVSALLLGNRENLSDSTVRDFQRCGIAHMLALSGLHMTVVIGFFDLIMKNLLVDKKIRCIILAFLSVSYLAITGFSSSASRAVIMLCTVYLAHLLNNESESITSLFIALTVILAFSPYAVYDVGLWMSFFATMGVIVIYDAISDIKYQIKKKPLHIRILINLTVSVAMTLAAVFSLCVFSWLFFGEISLISPITNMVFSPVMTLILILAILMLIFYPIPIFAAFIGRILVFLASGFTELASRISHLRGITVSLKYDFVPYIVIPLAVSIAVFLLIKLKRKWMISLTPIAAIIAFVIMFNVYSASNAGKCDIIYMKDKRNESLLVKSSLEVSVCDISTGGYDSVYTACAEAVDTYKATEIENLILTHYHNFHVKSLARVCGKYMVRNVYIPIPETDDELIIQEEIMDSLSDMGVNVVVYKRGMSITSAGVDISVSDTEYIKRSTHSTFLVCVSNETKTFAYATSAAWESKCLSAADGADILLFGCHGPTVKPIESKELLEEKLSNIPHTLMFSAPHEMLANKEVLSYVHLIYQNGHTVILDEPFSYKFNLN